MTKRTEPLLFNDGDIRALQESVRRISQVRRAFGHIRRLADETIDEQFVVPQSKRNAPPDAKIRGFDEHRVFVLRQQESLNQTIVGLNTALVRAACYAVTGNAKYGRRAIDILIEFARCGVFLEERKNMGTALGNSVFGINYLMSVDLLRGAFSPDEQNEVDSFLERLGNEIVYDSERFLPNFASTNVYSNHMAFHHGTVGVIGAYLGNRRFIRWALEGKAGFFDLVDRGILDRGLWQEGTTGYHFVALAALTYLAAAFRNRKMKPDLFTAESRRGNTLAMLFNGPVRLAFPDLSVPSIGDTYGYIYSLKGHGAVIDAWRFLRKPVYGWVLSQSRLDNDHPKIGSKGEVSALLCALLWSRERVSGRSPSARSELFEAHGYAVLRQIESREYWGSDSLVAVMNFDRSRQHSHADKLGIILFGKGKLLVPDVGAKSTEKGLNFLSLVRKDWNVRTAAHNTVVVDEQDQQSIKKQLKLVLYEKNRQFGIVSAADFGTLYPGVTQRRTLLMTDGYFLDVFSVASNETHVYDYVLRSFDESGQTRTADDVEPLEFGAADGPYSMMGNVRAMETDKRWSCHWKQGNVRFWLSMLGESNTHVIFAEGPRDDRYTPPNIPMVLVRRVAKQTHFVSLLVPSRSKTMNHALEDVKSAKGLLTLRIVGPEYEDHLVLSLSFRPRARQLTIEHQNKKHARDGIYLYKRFKQR